MKKFAKIINCDEYQAVVMRLSDNDNDEHIKIVIAFNNFICEPILKYGTKEEAADAAFLEINEDSIRVIIQDFEKFDE